MISERLIERLLIVNNINSLIVSFYIFLKSFGRPEVLKQLNIPSRYRVFCVIVLGYPKEGAMGREGQSKRFDMKDVYYRNKFGNDV